jgi:hypothetical protein
MKIHCSIRSRSLRLPKCVIAMSLLLNSALPIQPRQALQNATPAATTRPCRANPVLASGAKKKNNPKTKHPLPPEPPPACLEAGLTHNSPKIPAE